jgi:copper transport protein
VPSTPHGRRTVSSVLLLLAGLCALLLGTAGPASAHAALTASTPAAGSVVGRAPRRVTLTFSEGVSMSDGSIRVLGPHGRRADDGHVHDLSTAHTAREAVHLHGGLLHGTYTVAWKAVSADSHPVSGAFTFSVGAPSATSVKLPRQTAGGGVVGVLYGLGRYGAYAGFLLLVGGAVFVLACWPGAARVRAVQRVVVGGWVTLAAATFVMLLLRPAYASSGSLSDVLDLTGLKHAIGTKAGTALVDRLLLLAGSAVFVTLLFGRRAGTGEGGADADARRDVRLGLTLGGTVLAGGLAATWALTEHASTGIQTHVAMPVDIVHLLSVAAWLGGLAALLAALRAAGDGVTPPAGAVRRFSRLAFGSVLAVVATGTYQSWRQLGSWSALTDTTYGRLLLVKIALVAVLVALGAGSRRWTARLATPAEAEHRADTAPATAVGARPQEVAGGPAAGPGPQDPGPVRAAQLARQQAAVTAATRRRARDADPHRTALRRSVLAEAGVAVVILAVTTVLTATEPGRTAQAAPQAAQPAHTGPVRASVPFDTGGPHGKGTARLTLAPGRTGKNTLDVRTTTPGGQPLDAPEVRVAFTLPARKIGPIRVSPGHVGAGHWHDARILLPVPGSWQVAVTVRTSAIDEITETTTVKIG